MAALILNLAILSEDNEDTIAKIRGLDTQAQTDIMNLIKSFDDNNLKDGTIPMMITRCMNLRAQRTL